MAGILGATMLSTGPARPVIDLWPKGNPGGWKCPLPEVIEGGNDGSVKLLKNVNRPTLEIFRARNAPSTAPTVIVCPGGGYWLLAIDHEGWEVAQMLNERGIHAAVLKYRLPNRPGDVPVHRVPLQDLAEGIRRVRAAARIHGIGGGKVGAMGFSAGGHLVAAAAAQTEPRLDFACLIYPAYLTGTTETHVSEEVLPKEGAPPVFIVHTLDDDIPVTQPLRYLETCRKAKVEAEAHVYPKGGHGYGLRIKEAGLRDWGKLAADWILRR